MPDLLGRRAAVSATADTDDANEEDVPDGASLRSPRTSGAAEREESFPETGAALAVEEERRAAERAEVERREAEGKELERKEAERKTAERREAERKEAERKEAERKEAERKEAERKEAQRKEAERKEAERREAERKEAARKEAERKEADRKEAERKEAERKEAERKEAERKEAERREAERKEAERKEAERKEAERKEAERKEAERKEAERKEAQRKEAERKEDERKEVERREAQRKEAERKEAERKEAERREAERKEAERKEAERKEAERKEAERKDAQRKEAERKEAERKEDERKEVERREAQRKEAERKEAERKEAERREAERKEADRKEAERKEAERKEAERKEAERKDAERKEAQRKAEEKKAAERKEAERNAAQRKEIERKGAERGELEHKDAGGREWMPASAQKDTGRVDSGEATLGNDSEEARKRETLMAQVEQLRAAEEKRMREEAEKLRASAAGVECWDCKTINKPGYKYCDHCGATPKKVPAADSGKNAVKPLPGPVAGAPASGPSSKASLSESVQAGENVAQPTASKAYLRSALWLRTLEEGRIGRIYFGKDPMPRWQAEFATFLRSKRCAEVALFLSDLAHFKRNRDAAARAAEADRMYRVYVAADEAPLNNWDGAESAKLNISGEVRMEFTGAFKNDPSSVDVFNVIEVEMLSLLQQNNFEREFLALVEKQSRGVLAVLNDDLMLRIFLAAPLHDVVRSRRVSSLFRRIVDSRAHWEARSLRDIGTPCGDLPGYLRKRSERLVFADGCAVEVDLSGLRERVLLQSSAPLLPSRLNPATFYLEVSATGNVGAIRGMVGIAPRGGIEQVRGLPFSGEHFFSEKTEHPSDCRPLAEGETRGIGVEWPTKQIFLVQDGKVLFFESIADVLRTANTDLFASIVLEPCGNGGKVRFFFNFGKQAFSFKLDAHVSERVADVELSLRLKAKYALPTIRCTVCSLQVPITEDGVVEAHKCVALPPATPKKEEAGCVLQ